MSDAPFTLFIPFSNGSGYGNPGLTIRAESLDELNSLMSEFSDVKGDDPDGTSKLDQLLDGVLTVKAGVTVKFPQEEKPARPTQNPAPSVPAASDAPTCTHGTMKYKEGQGKNGKAYKGWFCPAPYGTQNQCKPQFIN